MDETVSDTERNTCATSYVTADNSRHMAYLISKVYVNERIKTDISKNDVYLCTKYIYSNINPNVIRFATLILGNKAPR
jgi:hypothetical protein